MLGGVLEEVGGKDDFAGLKDGDSGGAPEGEVALFGAFDDRFAGGEGLVDGANAGGSDLHDEDGAIIFRFEAGEGAFVRPEVGEVLGERDGGDGKKRAGEGFRFRGDSGGGEVVAVVIDGAEAGENEGALGIFLGESRIAKEGGEVKGLAFYEKGSDGGDVREAEVASIGGENDGSLGDRAGFWLELAVEEFVKAAESGG